MKNPILKLKGILENSHKCLYTQYANRLRLKQNLNYHQTDIIVYV